jgi:predicted GH43/DUF377 family glycosyl hydrolase
LEATIVGISSPSELFQRYPGNPIITAQDLPYAANTVFNAAATLVGEETVLLLRVEDRRGFSHLTVARSANGVNGWRIDPEPTFPARPDLHPEEIWGIEDPRITYVAEQGRWYVAYTAYSRGGPLVALAWTEDFKTFHRLGPVMAPEDKDAALFPVRFDGRWLLIHRPVPGVPHFGAHIWISYSPDLKHWGDHQILLRARHGAWWDANKIGLSPQPLLTDRGWLDRDDPRKVLRRSNEWVLAPATPYERSGDVSDVVFSCGWTLVGDELRVYYGAADTSMCLAIGSLSRVLDWLDDHNDNG